MGLHNRYLRGMSILIVLALIPLTTCGKDSPSRPQAPEPTPPPPPPPTPVATRVEISPSSANLTSVGQTVQLNARAFDQNNAQMSAAVVTWSSSAAGVATVSGQGLVTAVQNGTATITGRSGNASASITVTVTLSVGSIVIEPASATLMALGETVQLTAAVLDRNGQPIAGAVVTWTSSAVGVATVSAQGLVTAVKNGTATITARSGSASATSTVTVMQSVGSIVVEPASATLMALGETVQLTATVLDPNRLPVADAVVTWTSSDDLVATVSTQGLVTAVQNGVAAITARSGSASASIPVTVMQSVGSIAIEPASATLTALGETVQLTATVLDPNRLPVADAVLSWSSSDASVAVVSGEGLVTAVSNGTATITARSGSASATSTVTVMQSVGSIAIEPASATLMALGETVQLTATVLDRNRHPVADAVVSWSSSDVSVAMVSGEGLVTAISYGTAAITARSGSASSSLTVMVLDNNRDREVLIALYNATDGPNWSRSDNWLTDAPLESWYGVSATTEGTLVDTLVLRKNGLRGPVPQSLVQLRNLEWLDLHDNELTGTIPTELGRLQYLERLQLDGNQLTGPIPSSLGELQDLEQLTLDGNQLTGPIPSSLGQLQNLEQLTFERNQLSGPIPAALGQLQKLIVLNGRFNRLSGPIPSELGRLHNLDRLFLAGNQLTGPIPPALGNLDNLKALWLGDNQLSGPIPPELGNLQDLLSLFIFNNQLSGPIPSELGNLRTLMGLDLKGNELSGPIPAALGQLQNLSSLNLGGNALSGPIPAELGRMRNLDRLNLEGNELTGEIPAELGRLQQLKWLNIRWNRLTGPVPAELGRMRNLELLHLEDNKLTGSIPPELSQLQNLSSLYLNDNELTGPIPSELGKLPIIEWLSMQRNELTGGIPPSFGDLTNLRSLDLSHNTDMSGTLPSSLLNLADLVQLYLNDTGLCAPSDADFQAWLHGILFVRVDLCENRPVNAESVAYLTQATQSLGHPVPLVAGEDALLRVFVVADTREQVPMPTVCAHFYIGSTKTGSWCEQAVMPSVPDRVMEEDLDASANVLISGTFIQPGLEMAIEIDPDGALDPSLGISRRLPATGRAAVDVRDVPPFNLTLVPFIWKINPDHSMEEQLQELTSESDLFRLTRDLLPVKEFDLDVREAVWTSNEPIDDNKLNLLNELDAVRAMDGSDRYYKGILTSGGGIAQSGGFTTVSALVDEVIAHELGHNFSLGHPPCGGPANPDPSYPYSDGSIGTWGYDLLNQTLLDPGTPELMSYCDPIWISGFYFNKALGYRLSLVEEAPLAAVYGPSSRSLLLWGGIDEFGELVLNPAFAVYAAPSMPNRDGPYLVTGESEDGDILFTVSFGMVEVADGDGGKSFAFILPARPDWPDRLTGITLSGPEGAAEIEHESGQTTALLVDRITGRIRGILRDWLSPGESLTAARRTLPEPGLEVIISTGLPDPADWIR